MNEIVFRVVDDSLNDTQLDEALHALLDDLLELHVDATRLRTGQPPVSGHGPSLEEAKVVSQAITEPDVAKALAERVQAWLTRTGVKQLVIEVGKTALRLDATTAVQQDRLVEHLVGVSAR
ncbi:hypothetical protein [Umezawaea sp.]|uniref:hypothetical protein n=1 Tax=Umezawaea sp. TaxID=1955258 RepID=UPI002ED2C339